MMKKIKILLFAVSMLAPLFVQAQCEVLLESISGEYEGECKKGKANGKGISKGTDTYDGQFKKGYPDGQGQYTWSNGNVFIGNFKKGLKEGEGRLVIKESQKDSLVIGYWSKDNYIGKEKDPYKILYKSPE